MTKNIIFFLLAQVFFFLKRLEESGKIEKVKYRKKIFWLTEEEKMGKR